MLLHKLAQNHPEDIVNDTIWYICKKDYMFAKKLISQFVDPLNDFTVIDIVRNYIISDGFMPDLTFLLRHKKTNKITYIILETKITAEQNIHKRKQRIIRQYDSYANYLNSNNRLTNSPQEYNKPDNCILLCPSYFANQEEANVKEFRFPNLLTLLKDSENSDTEEIRNELIKYIEEEFEGTHAHLNKNLGILEHKIELKSAQKHLLTLRDTMLKEKGISKSGLWQTNCECYCYFGIGLKNKYIPKNDEKSWLSYDFFCEEDIFSPLKLSFPNELIKKGITHVAKYQNKHKFYCDLLIESKINDKFTEILNSLYCSDKLKANIIYFTNYYNQPNKQPYLVKFNEFLRSITNYIDRFEDIISNEYRYTYFEHSLNNKEILLRLNIKPRVNGQHYISIIAEPTCFNISKTLRMEVFKDSELIDTIELISEINTRYEVKYDINSLKEKIRDTFNELYKS